MTFTILDRMFFVNYLRSYLIVLTSLLSLYVIVDLFTNLDAFSGRGFAAMLAHVFKYYSAHLAEIFVRQNQRGEEADDVSYALAGAAGAPGRQSGSD